MSQPSVIVDARGKNCPEPVILTRRALEANSGKGIQVLLDSPVARENVNRLAVNKGLKVSLQEQDGEYCLTISP